MIAALLGEGREAAREKLAPISYPRREIVTRSDPSETVIASVYIRDRFHCRYCGCRVIPTQVMRLLSAIFPEEFPNHPNWKGGQTHPAITSPGPGLALERPGAGVRLRVHGSTRRRIRRRSCAR